MDTRRAEHDRTRAYRVTSSSRVLTARSVRHGWSSRELEQKALAECSAFDWSKLFVLPYLLCVQTIRTVRQSGDGRRSEPAGYMRAHIFAVIKLFLSVLTLPIVIAHLVWPTMQECWSHAVHPHAWLNCNYYKIDQHIDMQDIVLDILVIVEPNSPSIGS